MKNASFFLFSFPTNSIIDSMGYSIYITSPLRFAHSYYQLLSLCDPRVYGIKFSNKIQSIVDRACSFHYGSELRMNNKLQNFRPSRVGRILLFTDVLQVPSRIVRLLFSVSFIRTVLFIFSLYPGYVVVGEIERGNTKNNNNEKEKKNNIKRNKRRKDREIWCLGARRVKFSLQ